jgi:hypothetical protein
MSQSVRYSIHAVKLGATVIKAIGSSGLTLNENVSAERTTSTVYDEFQSIRGRAPVATFGTRDLAAALGVTGLAPVDVSTLSGGVVLYLSKHADGGTRSSSSDHRTETIVNGILVPRMLTCDHQGDAMLTYEVIATSDGVNDIVQVADNVALPSIDPDQERWTMGSVTLEEESITGMRSIQIDLGHRVTAEGADSDVDPTFSSVENISPSITIRGIDPTYFSSGKIPLGGLDASHANTTIYFRKRALGGSFVADGTAEHVKLTACGLSVNESRDGSSGSPAESSIRIPCRHDGTNAPLTVDETSAIT